MGRRTVKTKKDEKNNRRNDTSRDKKRTDTETRRVKASWNEKRKNRTQKRGN